MSERDRETKRMRLTKVVEIFAVPEVPRPLHRPGTLAKLVHHLDTVVGPGLVRGPQGLQLRRDDLRGGENRGEFVSIARRARTRWSGERWPLAHLFGRHSRRRAHLRVRHVLRVTVEAWWQATSRQASRPDQGQHPAPLSGHQCARPDPPHPCSSERALPSGTTGFLAQKRLELRGQAGLRILLDRSKILRPATRGAVGVEGWRKCWAGAALWTAGRRRASPAVHLSSRVADEAAPSRRRRVAQPSALSRPSR